MSLRARTVTLRLLIAILVILPLVMPRVSSAAQILTFNAAVPYTMGSHPYSATSYIRFGTPVFAVTNNSSNTVTTMDGNFVGGVYNGTFGTPHTYPVGNGPQEVVAGTLQSFDPPSLVVANSLSNSVSVLLGSFGADPLSPAVNYPVGAFPESVALGDFNGDGRLDIVAANFDASTLSVLLENADHTFQAAVSYGVSTNPEFVVVGDFNVDGKLDLATCNNSGNNPGKVNVLFGNGNGTFQTAAVYTVSVRPYTLTTADFNGDGKLDLATGNNGGNNVSVLLNNGDGTFATKTDYAVGAGPFFVNSGDFNLDLKTDIVVTNSSSNTVSILPGNGNGTFQAAINFTVGTAPFAVAVGDFNKDSRPDFVTANNASDNATVRLNATLPANDNWADAITITGASGFVTGTNSGATKETGEPAHASNAGGASVWYRWQPPANGSYTFTTYPSIVNTLLGIYTGTGVASLTGIASNDDDTASFCAPNVSRVTIPNADATKTYFIAIDGSGGATGDVALRWGRSTFITGEVHGGANRFELSGAMCQRASSYALTNIPAGGNYSVAAQDTGNFSAQFRGYGSCAINPLSGDVTNCNFVQTTPTFTASGFVKLANNSPLSGVSLTAFDVLGVDSSRSAFTGPDGSYVLNALWIGTSYVVSPSKQGYTFDPPTVTVSASGAGGGFVATPVSTITGRVTNVNGNGLNNALVSYSGNTAGTTSGSVFTDSGGNYSITAPNGSYTLQASYSTNNGTSVQFAPFSQDITLNGNATGPTFVANTPTFTVAGFMRNGSGFGLSGAKIVLSGSGLPPLTITTGGDGSYVSPPLHITGDYQFTPQSFTTGGKTYNFNPVQKSYLSIDLCSTVPGASCSGFNYTEANYIATPETTDASSITSSSATLNGNVNPGGQSTTAWFEWGTDPTLSSSSSTAAQSAGSGSTVFGFSASLTGLPASTTHYFRAVASNAGGTVRGNILPFTTLQPVRTLTVASSNPGSGVSITVTPNDTGGLGTGTTQFMRTYNNNTVVSLTAPSPAGGNNFQKWLKDGADFANNTATNVNVTMDANHTMTAVYLTPTQTLTVASSNPNSGVSITVSPNDNNAQGTGTTQFARTYNKNTVVSLTAPSPTSGNNFQKWLKDGADFANNTAANVTVTMDVNHTMTAVYVTPPAGPMIFVETGTNNLAAFDSVTFTRGPFALTDSHNFSSDQRTRIVFFTADLGFAQSTQPDVTTLSVQLNGKSYPVERVGPNAITSGSEIVFLLPSDLPAPGTYPLGIRINGVNSANTPNMQIVGAPSSPGTTPQSNKVKLAKYLLYPVIDLFL
jgi:hypothetical protein